MMGTILKKAFGTEELKPGKHYPYPAIPRQKGSLNFERLRRTRSHWFERFSPDEDDKEAEPRDELKGIAISIVATIAQFVVLTPWYFSAQNSKVYVGLWKSHYYIPHVAALGYISPQAALYAAVPIFVNVGWRAQAAIGATVAASADGFLGTTMLREQQAEAAEVELEQMRDQIDPSDVPDDKFLIPDDGIKQFDAPEPVAWLRKDESTLVFGKTQRGKTSGIKSLAAQLDYSADTAVIAHGSNDDYTQYFESELGLDTISISKYDTDAVWNMFREVPPDAHPDQAEEIFDNTVETLLPQRGKENPHFSENARNIVVACCMILWRKKENPDHADLYNLMLDAGDGYDKPGNKISDLLVSEGYADIAEAIRPGEKGDTFQGVTRQIRRNMKGSFKESGDFSFREYFQNPRGRVVSIETSEELKRGAEMFASMLDRANAQALDNDTSTGYFIYDELTKLGPIENLTDLASRGLKQGVRILIGVQTFNQFQRTYDDTDKKGSETKAIANNFGQVMMYQAGGDTVDWVQKQMGDETQVTESVSRGGASAANRTASETRRDILPSSTLTGLARGNALVLGPADQWWLVNCLHPDKAVPKMAAERGRFPVRSRSRSRSTAADSPTEETEQATADAWGSSRRD